MAGVFYVTSISNKVRTVSCSVVPSAVEVDDVPSAIEEDGVPSAIEVDGVPSVARTFSATSPSLPVSASVIRHTLTTLVSIVPLLTSRWVGFGVIVNHDFTRSLLKTNGMKWYDDVILLLLKLVEMQQVQFSSEKERATRVLPLLDELQQLLQALEEEDFAPFKEVVLHDLAPIVEEIRSLV